MPFEILGQRVQARRTASRQRQDMTRPVWPLIGCRCLRVRCGGFLHQDVGVYTAEAERADAGTPRRTSGWSTRAGAWPSAAGVLPWPEAELLGAVVACFEAMRAIQFRDPRG